MSAPRFGQKCKLRELVDLALCVPEPGAVNFNILHQVLCAILAELGIGDHETVLPVTRSFKSDHVFSSPGALETATHPKRLGGKKKEVDVTELDSNVKLAYRHSDVVISGIERIPVPIAKVKSAAAVLTQKKDNAVQVMPSEVLGDSKNVLDMTLFQSITPITHRHSDPVSSGVIKMQVSATKSAEAVLTQKEDAVTKLAPTDKESDITIEETQDLITEEVFPTTTEAQPTTTDTFPTDTQAQPSTTDTFPTDTQAQTTTTDTFPTDTPARQSIVVVQEPATVILKTFTEDKPTITDIQQTITYFPTISDVQPTDADVEPTIMDIQPTIADFQHRAIPEVSKNIHSITTDVPTAITHDYPTVTHAITYVRPPIADVDLTSATVSPATAEVARYPSNEEIVGEFSNIRSVRKSEIVHDIWKSANLDKRVSAIEDSIAQFTSLIDTMLEEFSNVRVLVDEVEQKFEEYKESKVIQTADKETDVPVFEEIVPEIVEDESPDEVAILKEKVESLLHEQMTFLERIEGDEKKIENFEATMDGISKKLEQLNLDTSDWTGQFAVMQQVMPEIQTDLLQLKLDKVEKQEFYEFVIKQKAEYEEMSLKVDRQEFLTSMSQLGQELKEVSETVQATNVSHEDFVSKVLKELKEREKLSRVMLTIYDQYEILKKELRKLQHASKEPDSVAESAAVTCLLCGRPAVLPKRDYVTYGGMRLLGHKPCRSHVHGDYPTVKQTIRKLSQNVPSYNKFNLLGLDGKLHTMSFALPGEDKGEESSSPEDGAKENAIENDDPYLLYHN